MKLPNLYTLRAKFMRSGMEARAKATEQFLFKLDLTNCSPSLKLPPETWGAIECKVRQV